MNFTKDKRVYTYNSMKYGKRYNKEIKNKSIYIFLTKTNTIMSNMIYYITKSEYTHAGISLDMKMDKLYSFSRVYKNNPFKGGFMHEDIENGVYARGKNIPCAIYELRVSEEVYKNVENRIELMMSEQNRYRYNVKGLIYHYFNITKQRPYYYFCSEFVAEILMISGATEFSMVPSLTKPRDLKKIPSAKLVFNGNIKELKFLSI